MCPIEGASWVIVMCDVTLTVIATVCESLCVELEHGAKVDGDV